jgi:hypothetical protein
MAELFYWQNHDGLSIGMQSYTITRFLFAFIVSLYRTAFFEPLVANNVPHNIDLLSLPYPPLPDDPCLFLSSRESRAAASPFAFLALASCVLSFLALVKLL